MTRKLPQLITPAPGSEIALRFSRRSFWWVPGTLWRFRRRRDAMAWIYAWERRQLDTYGPDWRALHAKVEAKYEAQK